MQRGVGGAGGRGSECRGSGAGSTEAGNAGAGSAGPAAAGSGRAGAGADGSEGAGAGGVARGPPGGATRGGTAGVRGWTRGGPSTTSVSTGGSADLFPGLCSTARAVLDCTALDGVALDGVALVSTAHLGTAYLGTAHLGTVRADAVPRGGRHSGTGHQRGVRPSTRRRSGAASVRIPAGIRTEVTPQSENRTGSRPDRADRTGAAPEPGGSRRTGCRGSRAGVLRACGGGSGGSRGRRPCA